MKKADIIIVILIAIIGISSLVYNASRLTDAGAFANIYVDGDLVETINLQVDQSVSIDTGYGINVIGVVSGEVFIESADCRDQICVDMKAISLNGQNIVCLPHHLHIEIENSAEEVEVDAISQ